MKVKCPNGCTEKDYPFYYPVNGDYVLLDNEENVSNLWSDGTKGVTEETKEYLKEMLTHEFSFCVECDAETIPIVVRR